MSQLATNPRAPRLAAAGGDGALDDAAARLAPGAGSLSREVLAVVDAVAELPVFGAKNSLNVATVATVALYEV